MMSVKQRIPEPIKNLYRSFHRPDSDRLFNFRYRHKQQHTLQYKDLKLTFDTSTLTAKRWFFPRYLDGSLHEPVVSKKLLDVLDTDSIFFDVGANVGFYSLLASQYCQNGNVHSFELDPRLTSIVASHFELSETQNTTIVCAAVSDGVEDLASFTPHQAENLSTNTIDGGDEQTESGLKVPSITLDRYCSETGIVPDVLKIDVEGFESHVLNGFTNTLSTSPPRALFLELHPQILKEFGISHRDVLSLLGDFGYTCYQFADHRSHISPDESLSLLSDSEDIKDNCMLYCSQ